MMCKVLLAAVANAVLIGQDPATTAPGSEFYVDINRENIIPHMVNKWDCGPQGCFNTPQSPIDMATEYLKSGMSQGDQLYTVPARRLKDALPDNMTQEAANFGAQVLQGAEGAMAEADREFGWEGRVATATKPLWTELKKDLDEQVPIATGIENAAKMFLADNAQVIDDHAAAVGMNFTTTVVPEWKKAADEAGKDFEKKVLPKVQKLTRAMVDWSKKVGQNGQQNLVPGLKTFGMNTAQSWQTKVQPVLEAWMQEHTEEASKFHELQGKIMGVEREVEDAMRYKKCEQDHCCQMEWPACGPQPGYVAVAGTPEDHGWCWNDEDKHNDPQGFETCGCTANMCPSYWPASNPTPGGI